MVQKMMTQVEAHTQDGLVALSIAAPGYAKQHECRKLVRCLLKILGNFLLLLVILQAQGRELEGSIGTCGSEGAGYLKGLKK